MSLINSLKNSNFIKKKKKETAPQYVYILFWEPMLSNGVVLSL